MPRLHIPRRLDGLVERIDPVDDRHVPSRLEELGQPEDVAARVPRDGRDNASASGQARRDRQGREVPQAVRGDEEAAGFERRARLPEGKAAHGVEDYPPALAVLRERLSGVVEHRVGAQVTHEAQMVRPAHTRHVGARLIEPGRGPAHAGLSASAAPPASGQSGSTTEGRHSDARPQGRSGPVAQNTAMPEERRLVTVLFADVVGSTSLGERLDPEDVRALLGRLFAIARDAVERHGGRVEKFIGDAVMAVFGLPTAHDDDPTRACAAALELRDRVREDAVLGERIEIRLGLATGEVIATRDPDATEFLVTGDPVNTAARLQQAANAWEVLVGERTVLASNARFQFGGVTAVDARGKKDRVKARPLVGPVPSSARGPRTRLVGRDADLAELRLAGERTFRERRPRLVSLIAPAGVGKSRLLEEFLDGLDVGITTAIAQCLPYGQRLTYWPLRAILLAILCLPGDASPELVREQLASWLAGAGEADAEHAADLIAATIGAAEAEGMDRLAVAGAWRRLVELVADRSPLVLVIEDLHWSSDSLLDLVDAMLQPRADVPLLMVALARPELLDRRPSWGGGRRNAVTISLEPLPDQAVAELVAGLLADPAPEIVHAVVERADGNPFYAGEIVRSLRESLGADADTAAIRSAVAALPDTVHGTVLARLDTLEPAARRVVQLGSVLGRSFEVRALPSLDGGLSDAAVQLAVDALSDRDFVRLTGRGTASFRHILIREVAYGTLPRRERAALHAGAGTWLEAEAAATGREDELAELIAFHLREATSLATLLGDPASEELVGRAVHWLRRAAESASAGAATVEAARHLEAAIALSPERNKADLYERLGQVWVGSEQAIAAFERAHALGLEMGAGSDQELRTASQAMVVYTRWAGAGTVPIAPEQAVATIERIRELTANTTSDRARMLGELALAFGPPRDAGNEDTAAAGRALALARELDDPELISAALDAFAVASLRAGEVDEVLGFVRQRAAIAHRLSLGERFDIANMTAWMETLRGNLETAEQATATARSWVTGAQAASWSIFASAWRTIDLHGLGRWDDALVEAGRAERSWIESAMRAPSFALGGFLAAYLVSRGRADAEGMLRWADDARAIAERSAPASRAHLVVSIVDGDPEGLSMIAGSHRAFGGRLDYVHLAAAVLADRRMPIDPERVDALIEHLDSRGVRLVAASARRLRGLLRGDDRDLSAALAAFETMHARPFAARARTELGLLTRDAAAIASGLAELETIGDVEQASRVASEATAAGITGVRWAST